MTTAIYAGSFDPITNGHLDVIESGAKIFDKLIVAVAYNSTKQGFLPVEDKISLIKECTKDIPNIEVDFFEGLTVNYAKEKGATVLLRGLRSQNDYDFEIQLTHNNRILAPDISTVFLMTKPEYSFISSSIVREILANDGDISKLVPKPVLEYLK
ncbi:MAG: pantetheine-phosphate adenylyltransferase [bacterium]|nr:pantetheine-phosphate adenylyltransferase [bacterium]